MDEIVPVPTLVHGSHGSTGNLAPMVDRVIGSSYDVVREVAYNLEYIKHVSAHLEQIYLVSGSLPGLDAIADQLDMLESIYLNLTNILAVGEITEEIVIVAGNITSVQAVATNLAAIQTLAAQIDAIITLAPVASQIAAVGDEIDAVVDVADHLAEIIAAAQLVFVLPDKVTAATKSVPVAVTRVRTNAYNAAVHPTRGSGYYRLSSLAEVTPYPVLSWFLSTNDRYFLLDETQAITPEMFGAYGDGVTADDTPLKSLIIYVIAYNKNINIDIINNYLVTGNIDNFWSIASKLHTKTGSITRSSNTFYLAPASTQTSVFHVGPAPLDINDGFAPDFPINVANIPSYMRRIASASTGSWRVLFVAGTYNITSRMDYNDIPWTTAPLEFEGPVVSWGVPTAILDGGGVASAIFYCASPNNTTDMGTRSGSRAIALSFKDLKFRNVAAGGQMVDLRPNGPCEAVLINCHMDGLGTASQGVGVRKSQVHVLGGIYENFADNGINYQHHSSGQVGHFQAAPTDPRVIIRNCGNAGVESTRFTSTYIEHCDFSNNNRHIVSSYVGRIRQRDNIYGTCTGDAMMIMGMSSMINGDLSRPSTFPGAVLHQPVIYAVGSTGVAEIADGPIRVCRYSGNFDDVVCSGDVRFIAPSPVAPLRVAHYFLASERNRIIVEYDVQVSANNSPLLELCGDNGANNAITATIQIPTHTGARNGIIRLETSGPRTLDNTARCFGEAKFESGPAPYYFSTRGSSSFVGNTFLWNASEVEKVWRLYITNTNGGSVTFYSRRTYLEY